MARPSSQRALLGALLLLGCLCLGAPALGAAAGQGPAQKPGAEGPRGVRDTSQGLLEASGELAEEPAQELAPEEGKVFTASFEFTGYSEGAEVPGAAPAPAPGPSGEYFYSSGPTGGPAEDLEFDSNGEPCMRNKAGVCVPVAYIKKPGSGTPPPHRPSGKIGSGSGSLEGGTPSTADGGHSFPYELEFSDSSGEEDPKETPPTGTKKRTGVPPKKKKTTGTKGKGTPPRPVPKKKAPGKGRVPKPKPKAKPKPRPKAKHPKRKQNARPKRKHLPMRQVDAQSVTKRARRGLRMQAKDCICPTIYQPVCGVSGQVFGNACEAQCAGIGVQFACPSGQDPCKCAGLLEPAVDPPCLCTKELMPVCGANGRVYANKCLAACAKTAVCGSAATATGTCTCKTSPPPPPAKRPAPTPAKDGCVCDMMLAPVCGKDGKWYSNDCVAACAKSGGTKCSSAASTAGKSCICAKPPPPAKKKSKPPPPTTCRCTKELMPVCGANGKAFANKCLAACQAVKVACPASKAAGACTCKAPPPPAVSEGGPGSPAGCFCTAEFSPVCSADGQYYSNACLAGCAKASVACPAAPAGPPSPCRCLLD